MDIIKSIEHEQLKNKIPELKVGNTVKVHVRIKEGNKEKVELVRVGKARRARLFYLRDRVGKSAKTKEMVGARIEDREIIVKEDISEEPVVEEAPVAETSNVENTETSKEENKTE